MLESVGTAGIPEDQRFDYWRHVVSDTFVPLEATRDDPEPFAGELRGASLGGLRLYEVSANSHVVRRTKRLIDETPGDFFKLGLQLDGHSLLVQDGREASLHSGDFAVYDTTRPYTFAFDDGGRMLVLIFPRAMLGLSADRVARLTAMPFSGSHGLGSLISSFLTRAAVVLDDADVRDNARLATNVLDLLTTGLSRHLDLRPADVDGARRALLLRTMTYIEQHLADASLTPGRIAGAQHISTRYLHKLFEAEGTTVSAWIRHRRLRRCSNDLCDPALACRSVSAIAARWGLPDAAHFSRLFRAAYGVSPRDFRLGTPNGLGDA